MSISAEGEPKELPTEVLKLLLQVAWADGVVQAEERALIASANAGAFRSRR